MRKLSFFLVFCLAFSLLSRPVPVLALPEPDVAVNAKSAYMVNLDTGTVVYQKDPERRTFPASLTKIMTSILVLESVQDLDGTTATAKSSHFDEFVGMNVSSADIWSGETFSMRDYLYAMLVQSGNEAANIVADELGPGIPAFVEKMNEKARQLGCKNTNFVNPHGLGDDNQYTTAYDMYLITKYAMSLPGFMDMVSATRYVLPATSIRYARTLQTTNRMMEPGSPYYYEGVRGVKTGTLDEGRCFVSTCTLDGLTYLAVLMDVPFTDAEGNASTQNLSFVDAKNLFDWAFSTFQIKTLLDTNQVVDEVNVRLAWEKDFVHLYPESKFTALVPAEVEESTIRKDVKIEGGTDTVNAPIEPGQKLGTVDLILEDEVIGTVGLVATEEIKRSNLLYYLDLLGKLTKQWWFKLLVGLLAVFIVVYIVVCVLVNRKKRKMKSVKRRRRF